MKRLIVTVVLLMMPCIAWAVTMCARDDALAISLVPGIGGTNSVHNAAEYTWRASFSYGTILGEATCLSAAEGGEGSKQFAFTNTSGEMLSYDIPKGLHGTDDDGNERGYCWCRMTHPVLSRWVFLSSSSASLCASLCASNCAYFARSNVGLRSGLFGSVGR